MNKPIGRVAVLSWIARQRGKSALLLTLAGVAVSCSASPAAGAACPGQGDAGASAGLQEQAMLCLVNRARTSRGLAALAAPSALARAADRKSADIIRCDEFSHEACGREFTFWFDRVGYRYCSAAENIAYASGGSAAPRTIFGLWMNSAGHRRNILGPYRDLGIGLRVGDLDGTADAHVWTQEFGTRDC
jgi:uncharacterized protein YkwD